MRNRDTYVLLGMIFLMCFALFGLKKCQHSDYKNHMENIGKTVVLNNDTLYVRQWYNGDVNKRRGYLLSNGIFIDEKTFNVSKIQ